MALKVGELARRSGLTVHALHHYDRIGLLRPSARSGAGYRLYSEEDIARLHQIQALRRFGMALADIATVLARPDAPFARIVAQQIAALEQQIAQATALHQRLRQLQRQLADGAAPGLDSSLETLELMALYDKYFTPEELQSLPARSPEWPDLIRQLQAQMDSGAPADSEHTQQLALRWMRLLERDTGAHPGHALRISAMVEMEPAARCLTGITEELKQYMLQGLAAFRLSRYAPYLSAGQLARLRASAKLHGKEWITLIAEVHRLMADGVAPHTPEARAVARQWMRLFQLRAGSDPAMQDSMRRAHEGDPDLLAGTWITDAMLDYIRAALA
ncbi:MerR family transcriptional regulator [Oxalobacteraceae bacterium A2-2]